MSRLSEITVGTLLGAATALALVYGIDHDPDLAPTPADTVSVTASPTEPYGGWDEATQEIDCWDDASCAAPGHTITEDDARWNCLTMGNRVCGPQWQPLPEAMYSRIGISDDETCVWLVDETTLVACTDGQVVAS